VTPGRYRCPHHWNLQGLVYKRRRRKVFFTPSKMEKGQLSAVHENVKNCSQVPSGRCSAMQAGLTSLMLTGGGIRRMQLASNDISTTSTSCPSFCNRKSWLDMTPSRSSAGISLASFRMFVQLFISPFLFFLSFFLSFFFSLLSFRVESSMSVLELGSQSTFNIK
jgi:hypothetical protein